MKKVLYVSPRGHQVIRNNNNVVIDYSEEMISISTSQLNGGIREVDSSFNNQLSKWVQTIDDLPGGNLNEYFKIVSTELKLSPERTTGLITSASMDNLAIVYENFKNINIMAVVTAGVDVNAVRAGDPASYYETEDGKYTPICGTINVMLVLEFNTPVENLVKAVIVATEAKTAALQEMNIKSCFSNGIATGTGTDGIIIACHKNDVLCFSDVSNHSKVGEIISKVVKKGVKNAIKRDRDKGDG